ncbi:class I SAM-dependent methyltransferase [Micromonospora purpureochromogenes]|uniref:class I SAM-dependent methyltransferase n=1 Tax=Micromonospora purpureochromogenes TaxID=47872 RepID=UPI0033F48467
MYSNLYRDYWHEAEDLEVGRLLADLAPDKGLVVDLGCGQGLGLRLLRHHVNDSLLYVGIDTSWEMLKHGDVAHVENSLMIRADMQSVPISDASAAMVTSLFSSLSYLEEPKVAFAEMARVLAPGGRYLVMCLSRRSLRRILGLKAGHVELYGTSGLSICDGVVAAPVRLMTKSELAEQIGSNGLVVTRIVGQSPFRAHNDRLTLLWLLSRLVGRFAPDLGHTLIAWGYKPPL